MTPAKRDPKVAALAALDKARGRVEATTAQATAARGEYRRALLGAVDAGVSKADMARRLSTSESRVRQLVLRARSEAE